jgi:UDP-hydrolysing UDP-N-acetyl-D-glucosamine 2-epimerase
MASKPLKVCAVTSNRADWGLLAPPLALMRDDPAFDLVIVVTGQHLMSGGTARDITDDGFAVAETIDMAQQGDTPTAVTAALANALKGFGEVLARRKPDLLMVLGDRTEITAAVTAAVLARIPVAHLCGGDITEGATDDAFRHAMTKMSHLHFVTTEDAARRVRQMGEAPERVVVTGSTGLDRIRTMKLMGREAFFASVGLTPRPKNIMVTFHPETLAADTERDCAEMLAGLDGLGSDVGLVFSGSNTDVQGMAISRLIEAFVKTHPNAVLHASLGSQRYFSALKHCDLVVGNSSSGLYEAPSFGLPTVNIGDRQKGRLRAAAVIDVKPTREEIGAAITRGFAMGRKAVTNPYGDGHASERILARLKSLGDPQALLRKSFNPWPAP